MLSGGNTGKDSACLHYTGAGARDGASLILRAIKGQRADIGWNHGLWCNAQMCIGGFEYCATHFVIFHKRLNTRVSGDGTERNSIQPLETLKADAIGNPQGLGKRGKQARESCNRK